MSIDGFRVLLWELLSILHMWILIILMCARTLKGPNCSRTTDVPIWSSIKLTQRHSLWFLLLLLNLPLLILDGTQPSIH